MQPFLRDAKSFTLMSRTLSAQSDGDGDARESYSSSGLVNVTIYPMSSKEASEVYGKVNGDVCLGLARTSKTIGIGDRLTSSSDNYKIVGCTKYAVGAYQLDLWRD